MGKKIIIGCSPGCSGSMSFAELLGMQKEIFSNHEIFLRQQGATFNEKYLYYNSWKSETSDINVFKKFIEGCYKKDLFTMLNYRFADIAPYYLTMLKEIENNEYFDAKIVILKRNKDEFLNSLEKKFLILKNTRNKNWFFNNKMYNFKNIEKISMRKIL